MKKKIWIKNPKQRGYFADAGVHRRIILQFILKKGSYGAVAGSCKYGNEPSCFISGGEFLDQLSDYQLLMKRVYPKVSGLAAWSEKCKRYSSLPRSAVVSLLL
jgi:hypothetical protein